MKRTLVQLAEDVHRRHVAGLDRETGPMAKAPPRIRRTPQTAIIAEAAKRIVHRGTKS